MAKKKVPNTEECFLAAVDAELKCAMEKFPGDNATLAALVEEVGEVGKALMYEPWDNVFAECVQVAAMAMRLAVYGDDTMYQFRAAHADYAGVPQGQGIFPPRFKSATADFVAGDGITRFRIYAIDKHGKPVLQKAWPKLAGLKQVKKGKK